jgi:hypothetical protein
MRKAFLTVAVLGLVLPGTALAQTADDPTTYRLTGTRIAIAQDIRIDKDEEVTDGAVVVGGDLIVDGRVRDGVVVVGGNLHLSSTADVRGEIVLVGGTITRDAGARQLGSISHISFGEWSRSFGWLPVIRFGNLDGYGRWLSLAGTIARVSVLGLLMAILLVIARAPVARVGRAAFAEPLRALIIGLAAEIFFVPFIVAASIGLAITIIGIPFVALLVPLAIITAVFAFVLGFTALACRIGEAIEDRLGWQPGNAFIATAIGFFVLLGPTLAARFIDLASFGFAPFTFALIAIGLTLEFIAWTMGVGAAIMTGLGRWYTVPPPITAPPQPPSEPGRFVNAEL